MPPGTSPQTVPLSRPPDGNAPLAAPSSAVTGLLPLGLLWALPPALLLGLLAGWCSGQGASAPGAPAFGLGCTTSVGD